MTAAGGTRLLEDYSIVGSEPLGERETQPARPALPQPPYGQLSTRNRSNLKHSRVRWSCQPPGGQWARTARRRLPSIASGGRLTILIASLL